jgi:hypothetical protein
MPLTPLGHDEYRILERLLHPLSRTYARTRLERVPLVLLEAMAETLGQAAADVRAAHAARRERLARKGDVG